MDKKVLIISSSPRKGGNSETLAAAFAKGAREAGNQVENVYLREKQIGFCKGCLACLNLGHCVILQSFASSLHFRYNREKHSHREETMYGEDRACHRLQPGHWPGGGP